MYHPRRSVLFPAMDISELSLWFLLPLVGAAIVAGVVTFVVLSQRERNREPGPRRRQNPAD